MDLTLRLAEPADAAGILAIYAPIVRETAISFELEPPSEEEMRRRIETTLEERPWLVCADGGGIAGYAYASRWRERAAYQWTVETTVYVHPDHQRRGVARGLYAALLEALRAQGFATALAGIALPNPASVRCHEACGFQWIGVYRAVGYKLGAWHDVGWLQLSLRDGGEGPVAPPCGMAELVRKPELDKALQTGLSRVRYPRFSGESVMLPDPHHPGREELSAPEPPEEGLHREEERLAFQEALRRSREHLQFVADAAAVNLAHCNAERRFVFVNRSYAERLGLTPDQVIGRPVAEVLGEEAYESIRPYIDRALSGEAFQFEVEINYNRLGRRYLHCAYTPERDAEGRVVGWVAAVTDMTDRHRLEQELRRSEEALREADRRKDEFLATLAHELRNPLAPVRNAVQILRMQGPQDPQLHWARDVIDRQVQQLSRLVDDLLDVSRITRGRIELRPERIELAALLERALETSRPMIEAAQHRLTVSFPEGPLELMADLTRMAQVVSNLLNNAAKYTRPGGHIHLSAEGDGGQAVIRVRDNGIGIPKEMLSRIFDMFAQVDASLERSQGGLGIGLTIARRLVEMHGGALEGASDGPGQGSEFTVRLPLAPETARRPAPAEKESRTRPASPLRILVADDNQDSANSLALWLQILGHDVRTAHDGPQALSLAKGGLFDLLLLDIGMPGMSGYDVARQLRQRPETRNTLLVAMTGWGQEEDRRRSREAGFDEHLVKPLEPKRLEDLLARLAR